MIQKRKCTKCKKEKPFNQFDVTKHNHFRLRCRVCRKIKPKVFVSLQLKMKTSEYKSIRQAAMNRGFSIKNYILGLHRKKIKNLFDNCVWTDNIVFESSTDYSEQIWLEAVESLESYDFPGYDILEWSRLESWPIIAEPSWRAVGISVIASFDQ